MSHSLKIKKAIICIATAVVLLATQFTSAFACTMIYVGSDMTEDGGTYFARSEDISNSYNKVFYVSPAGNHVEGEEYTGCYGFKYTFTHDSYSYTAVRDDNLLGTCPDCGESHDHTAYEEVGTNEMGVTVTATVTLGGNKEIKSVDPMDPLGDSQDIWGIEEAEICTVLLSEAASAKEALDLLLNIYDTVGADGGSGIIIADQSEAWYVENCTGTQYIALKLNPELVFISPNMSTIGLIDLDDENVIASEKLIETAQTAGTFVGDAEANTIDYRASYSNTSINSRMINGMNYLSASNAASSETTVSDDFTISNVKDGEIVPFYTNIKVDGPIDIEAMVDFYKVDGIGNTSNLEYHIYQIGATGDEETNTVQWMGFDHGAYGVMIPYYAMLTEDTYEAYQVGTEKKGFSETEPESGAYYPGTTRVRTAEGMQTLSGYITLPENWADSYYWSFDAVSNYVASGLASEAEKQLVVNTYAALQDKIYASFEEMESVIEDLYNYSPELAAEYATEYSAAMAETAHQTAVALYNTLANNEKLALPEYKTVETPVWFSDVASDDWCAEGVQYAAENGLFNGYSDNTFKPNENMTRAMFVAVLYRMAGSPDVSDLSVSFKDIPADAYYADAVKWAASNGIVNGYDADSFCPNKDINREQIITILYRYAAEEGADVSTAKLDAFSDAGNISAFAKDAMAWAVNTGVTNGTSATTLSPDSTATRAQVAMFLMRFCEM